MNYLYTHIIGSFIFDDTMHLIDSLENKKILDYLHKTPEQSLRKKHHLLEDLPLSKLSQALFILKDKKYFAHFHQLNLALTKQKIKSAVSEDQLIIQAIANIGELDKTCNLLSKRLREWYALYCPEVGEKISDHARLIQMILENTKASLMKELQISETMGADLAKVDIDEMMLLAKELHELYQLRQHHEEYLQIVMQKYCPNLMELAGVTIGAKLLEIGRGLKHLALLPASTIQLLGAEKALFRHITTGARSPKYGILYQHPLVQKSRKQARGKMARNLADKLSLCARLDYFKGEFKAKEYRKELEEKFSTA